MDHARTPAYQLKTEGAAACAEIGRNGIRDSLLDYFGKGLADTLLRQQPHFLFRQRKIGSLKFSRYDPKTSFPPFIPST